MCDLLLTSSNTITRYDGFFELLFVSLTGTTFRQQKHLLFLEFADLSSSGVIISGEHCDVILFSLASIMT